MKVPKCFGCFDAWDDYCCNCPCSLACEDETFYYGDYLDDWDDYWDDYLI